jgi:hypothetical protein
VPELWTLGGKTHGMKTVSSLLALLATTILIGCSATSSHRDSTGLHATDITVSVTCSEPSMRFTGKIISDGHTEQLSGAGSGTFHARGQEFVCSFKKTDADGQISFTVSVTGKKLGDISTSEKYGEITARVQHDRFTPLW